MDASRLSNYQLYEILRYNFLQKDIVKLARREYENRKLSNIMTEKLEELSDKKFPRNITQQKLNWKYNLLLLVIPFPIVIYNLFIAHFFGKGYYMKCKQAHMFITIGLFTWTVLFFLFVGIFHLQ